MRDKLGYRIVSCNNCTHIFLDFVPDSNHVSSIYSMDYFKGNKCGYPDYLQLSQLLIQRGHYYSEIVKRYTSPGSLLDIGCGAGFVMKGFSEEGWKVKGIEPNNEMSDYANKYFGFHVTAEPLEKHEDENTYDLITMIQVVAHFYDVRTCIDKAAGMLKPNGMLLIETWDRNSITAKLMGHAWHEYSTSKRFELVYTQNLDKVM